MKEDVKDLKYKNNIDCTKQIVTIQNAKQKMLNDKAKAKSLLN